MARVFLLLAVTIAVLILSINAHKKPHHDKKKPHISNHEIIHGEHAKPATAPTHITADNADSSSSSSSSSSNSAEEITEQRVREIVHEELDHPAPVPQVEPYPDYGNNDHVIHTSQGGEHFQPLPLDAPERQKLNQMAKEKNRVLIMDHLGNIADYEATQGKKDYRQISPTSLCATTDLVSTDTTAQSTTNKNAAISTHNTVRAKLNSCTYKPMPNVSPALPTVIGSKALFTMAQNYSTFAKNTYNCALTHSSNTDRTVTFTKDDGTVVTNQYTGENLASFGICFLDSLSAYNTWQAQYCKNGYLFTQSTNNWFNEVTSYQAILGPNSAFPTQAAQNTANGNSNTVVGHFTQVAWSSSNTIGLAVAECASSSKTATCTCSPAGSGGCSASGTIPCQMVCYSFFATGRYYQGGNYQNQNPWTSTGPC